MACLDTMLPGFRRPAMVVLQSMCVMCEQGEQGGTEHTSLGDACVDDDRGAGFGHCFSPPRETPCQEVVDPST